MRSAKTASDVQPSAMPYRYVPMWQALDRRFPSDTWGYGVTIGIKITLMPDCPTIGDIQVST